MLISKENWFSFWNKILIKFHFWHIFDLVLSAKTKLVQLSAEKLHINICMMVKSPENPYIHKS